MICFVEDNKDKSVSTRAQHMATAGQESCRTGRAAKEKSPLPPESCVSMRRELLVSGACQNTCRVTRQVLSTHFYCPS